MNVSGINYESIVDGEGVRVVLYVSGCAHHCKGCHNPSTWDANSGKPFTEEIQNSIYEACKPDYIDGLTLSGGCPMCNAKELIPFVKSFKKRFPRKTIWCYCGETVEEITEDPKSDKYNLLNLVDVIVDGQFVLEKKNPNLAFRGSSNQRIIKVTHKNGKVSYRDVSSTYSHDK